MKISRTMKRLLFSYYIKNLLINKILLPSIFFLVEISSPLNQHYVGIALSTVVPAFVIVLSTVVPAFVIALSTISKLEVSTYVDILIKS